MCSAVKWDTFSLIFCSCIFSPICLSAPPPPPPPQGRLWGSCCALHLDCNFDCHLGLLSLDQSSAFKSNLELSVRKLHILWGIAQAKVAPIVGCNKTLWPQGGQVVIQTQWFELIVCALWSVLRQSGISSLGGIVHYKSPACFIFTF